MWRLPNLFPVSYATNSRFVKVNSYARTVPTLKFTRYYTYTFFFVFVFYRIVFYFTPYTTFFFAAVVYSFNVEALVDAQNYANRGGIVIKYQNVIYHFLEDVKREINSRLPPKEMEEITGTYLFYT